MFDDCAVHVELDDSDTPFNKSRLINRAVAQHAGHVCVITDADAFVSDWTLREAIRLADIGAKLPLPPSTVCRMTREQSRRVLRWAPADSVSGKLYRHQRTRTCPCGLWVVRSGLFQRHRMDERFHGWDRLPPVRAVRSSFVSMSAANSGTSSYPAIFLPLPVTERRSFTTWLRALAIRLDQLIRDGQVTDQAELARLGHVSRARLTQIMNLLLAPSIEEEILFLTPTQHGRAAVTERDLRPIAAAVWVGEAAADVGSSGGCG